MACIATISAARAVAPSSMLIVSWVDLRAASKLRILVSDSDTVPLTQSGAPRMSRVALDRKMRKEPGLLTSGSCLKPWARTFLVRVPHREVFLVWGTRTVAAPRLLMAMTAWSGYLLEKVCRFQESKWVWIICNRIGHHTVED
jgi:hypothetical protein